MHDTAKNNSEKREQGRQYEQVRRPSLTVIVPVYNAAKYLDKLINALLAQDYPHERYNIVLVDNKSTDESVKIMQRYDVAVAFENKIASSYAARNKGLSLANSDLVAFTDADCVPHENWLSRGVEAINETDSDIVSGRIDMKVSEYSKAAELYDSLHFLRTEINIQNQRAQTANLFVRRELFEKVGYFAKVRSGGDFEWTDRAARQGAKITHCRDAIVSHPARKFGQLMAKSFRVGTGKPFNRMQQGFGFFHELLYNTFYLLPLKLRLRKLANDIKNHTNPIYKKKKCKILLVAFISRMVSRIGSFYAMMGICFKRIFNRNNKSD
jgi:glycosyltransferase involved in cell wall biosynthesis